VLILDNGSAFLDNNGIILDIPTLPHSLLQNPATIKSQVNPESQASSIRTAPKLELYLHALLLFQYLFKKNNIIFQ
jgi:hypothetical protein